MILLGQVAHVSSLDCLNSKGLMSFGREGQYPNGTKLKESRSIISNKIKTIQT